ncbi:aliphatic nitrilase [Jannaschia faecimaris]|uniref:Aliphatic nitrilase n=1 Tax=Jannaschia faecimaris TaxID=1244108 RepID=A0A1H3NJL8_9RHOB|nr:carbon-nitrogen hydrolase family protein [Jannaschia faecimaris]SDY89081.1 aliphatic nitrilase [Jannaschia faecimaris]
MTAIANSPLPNLKVAACHVAPVFLDTEATVAKAVDLIGEAARNGAEVIVFPESYIPAFPVWVALQSPIQSHDLFRAFARASIRIDGPEIAQLREAALQHDVYVSVGFSESTDVSLGCLWNSNALIGPDGSLINHHRKLVPTYYEKLVWASGDAAGLQVSETRAGRIGMLICGENTNPLARYALMAQGEQLHLSTYPPIWPTRPSSEAGGYDLKSAIRIRAGAHAFEAKVFNVVASGFVDASLRKVVETLGPEALETFDTCARGVSMVVGPTGEQIGGEMQEDEGILYCDISLADCIEPKQFHDVVGYYNRFDIFRLEVDRTRRPPAEFVGGSAKQG